MNNRGVLDIKTIVFMYMIAMKVLKVYFLLHININILDFQYNINYLFGDIYQILSLGILIISISEKRYLKVTFSFSHCACKYIQ